MKSRVCLIEDDSLMGGALVERLRIEGFDCDWFQRGREAVPVLTYKRYQLVISDIRLPDVAGDVLFEQLRTSGLLLPPFLFITGHGAIDQAVHLLKLGAADYLTKPLDVPLLMQKVRDLVSRATLSVDGEPQLGISSIMRNIEAMLARLAQQARTVLITGESGVGKEVVARAFHERTRNGANKPFVAVNCGAITESLMEAELFGHDKGVFTGAMRERHGYFEQADGGTLFLDEIGEMPLSMQVKLLRAIQERAIVRVGGERSITVDIRLVCATNRDLKTMVDRGQFREDLYYRIHVVQLDVPPLRERREDILWLAGRFLDELRGGGQARALHPDAQRALVNHPWPGNVRELRNCLERACILDGATVLTAESLFGAGIVVPVEETVGPFRLADYVADAERRLIQWALADNHGRIAETASQLGISRKNLWEKMRKLAIPNTGDEPG